LLGVEPDIGRYLDADEWAGAAKLRVPVLTIEGGSIHLHDRLEAAGFAGILLEGLLVHEVYLGDQVGMRLLGPGDLIARRAGDDPLILDGSQWRAAEPLRLAVLGGRVMLALQRWPSLVAGLAARMAQQLDRMAAQLLVCQLSRVEDRVLGVMWLMAETWGRVTPMGTRLPLDLTHEAIGLMIGARRPTVSLAVRELTEQGALVRQDGGWLLLKPPGVATVLPTPTGVSARPVPLRTVLADETSRWDAQPGQSRRPGADVAESYAALRETLVRMRQQHAQSVERFASTLTALQNTREACEQARRRVASERITRLRPPPS
jgi:CRP-like cAMP-binding protein